MHPRLRKRGGVRMGGREREGGREGGRDGASERGGVGVGGKKEREREREERERERERWWVLDSVTMSQTHTASKIEWRADGGRGAREGGVRKNGRVTQFIL